MGVAKMTTLYQILKKSNLVTERANSHAYNIIQCTFNIRAYNIDDFFHTGRIDPTGMVKIVYIIVCTSKLNNNIITAKYNSSTVKKCN